MVAKGPDRGHPSALRGWLSEVYLPSLLDAAAREQALAALAGRLGPKSTVDDPVHGRVAGMPAVREHLGRTAQWLEARAASYTRAAVTQGVDRDVTEGALSLVIAGKAVNVPVAVVAERRKSREVEVRVYYATQGMGAGNGDSPPKARPPLVADDPTLALAQPLDAFLAALTRADVAAIAATFEEDGAVRDPRGLSHAKKDGALASWLGSLLAGGVTIECGGAADDGRTCALELTLVRAGGREAPRAGLFVLERGDSALLRSLRVYGDLGG